MSQDNININVEEINDIVNIVSSEVTEVIDINVQETTEQVTLNITEEIVEVNINKVINPLAIKYYGAWQDEFTQTAAASNIGYPMKFHTQDITPNGISIVNNGSSNPTKITFANSGIYNLQFSSQFQNTSNQLADVTIWLRKNGNDVAGSAGFVSVPNSHGGTAGHNIAAWNYFLEVSANDYYELVWSTTNHTNVTMHFYSAGNPPPAAASVILTITNI